MQPLRRFSSVAKVLTIGLLFAPLGGCSFFRETIGLGAQKPKVQLSQVEVTKASFTSLDLMVTLRVDNPNDFALNFSKLKYKMVAGDLALAAGTFAERVSVPAVGHALIKLPLTVDSNNAIKLAQQLLTKADEVFAVMTATADFETPLGQIEVNFEDKHELKKLAGF